MHSTDRHGGSEEGLKASPRTDGSSSDRKSQRAIDTQVHDADPQAHRSMTCSSSSSRMPHPQGSVFEPFLLRRSRLAGGSGCNRHVLLTGAAPTHGLEKGPGAEAIQLRIVWRCGGSCEGAVEAPFRPLPLGLVPHPQQPWIFSAGRWARSEPEPFSRPMSDLCATFQNYADFVKDIFCCD
jgi:hypothetical protein